jgi:leucyl aminopeptidase
MPGFRALPLVVRFESEVQCAADILAVPVFEREDPHEAGGLDAAVGGEWSRARAAGELTGKPFEQLIVPASGLRARRVLFVGAGPLESFGGDMARRVAATAALVARQRRAPRVAILLRGLGALAGAIGDRTPARVVQAAAEGATLGQLETAALKTGDVERVALTEVALVVSDPTAPPVETLRAAAERGRILAECTNQARLLGNEPANLLTPRVFAERTEALAAGTDLQVEVLDETESFGR